MVQRQEHGRHGQKILEKEELHFRKMLKQGGKLKIKNLEFEIQRTENKYRNSKGEYESAAKPHNPDQWR